MKDNSHLYENSSLKKSFDRNHLIIMALGNIIGSGIFLASGIVISLAGPAVILAYAAGGLVMLLEVMFIAEMSIVNPAPGSFKVHASEVFGPGIGFINGWMFWCSGVLGMASEVTAAAVFSSLWLPGVPLWVFCLLYSAIMTLINFKDARGLSRIEMWLASVKVITLAAFIIIGFLFVLRIIPSGLQVQAGSFGSLSSFLPNGIRGVLASMLIVLFSYTGTGIIGLAIAETNQPERNVPPAIYRITLSVTALYVLSVLFIVLFLPWKNFSPSQSPFVVILQNMGIPFGAGLLNFIVLTAALSGLNSSFSGLRKS